jgi:hypothetical protein
MGKVGKRFVLLLDIDRVLSAAELAAGAAIPAGPPEEAGGGPGQDAPAQGKEARVP